MDATNQIFLNEEERVFDEQVDMEALRKILDNYDQIAFKNKLKMNLNGYFKEITKDELFPKLKELYIQKLKNTSVDVNFTNAFQVGRFFGKSTIQMFPREVRQTICKNLYYDLDIINCQAVIMENIISDVEELKCDNLEYYNRNRTSCLQHFQDNCKMSRDEAKQIFVAVLNGGKRDERWFKKNYPTVQIPSYLKGLHTEVLLFFDYLNNEDNDELDRVKEYVVQKNSDKESRGFEVHSDVGSLIANYCQTQECKILSHAIRFLRNRGVQVSTPFFDGCHIYQSSFPSDEEGQIRLLRDLEEDILQKLNFRISFKLKEMDEALDISNLSIKEENSALYTSERDNFDLENMVHEFTHFNLAKIFYKYYPDSYLYSEKVWYERNEKNIWKKRDDEPLSIRKNIHAFFESKINQKIKMLQNESDKPSKEALKSVSKCLTTLGNSSFKDGVIKELRGFYNKPDIYEKLDQNIHIFPFDDGCLDLTTSEISFRPIRVDDYVSLTCGYNYPKECDGDIKATVLSTFRKMFKEDSDLDYALATIASCLRGSNYFEKFFNFVGTGRNGKSLFFDACEKVFQNFWGVIPIEWFYTYSSKDSSKGSAEMDRIVLSRVFYATEGETGNGERLAIDKVKRMTGGDKISYRAVYGRKQNTFTPKGTLFFNTNKILEVKTKVKEEVAFVERFVCHKFPYTFKAGVQKEEGLVKKADPKLKDEFKRNDKYRDALLHILVDYYRKEIFGKDALTPPQSVLDATNAFLKEEETLIQNFLTENNYSIGSEGDGEPMDLYQEFLEAVEKTDKDISRQTWNSFMVKIGYEGKNHSNVWNYIIKCPKQRLLDTQSGKPPM
jgi:phage/plasmid-associated DNA primase